MSAPNEKELRTRILTQAADLEPGNYLQFFRGPEVAVARDLVREKLVDGSAKETGGVGITGIRDAGKDWLKAQTPAGRLKRGFKWAALLFATAAIRELVKRLVSGKW